MTPEVKAELRRLAEQGKGRLTADNVVKAAKAKDSPLHTHFDWNDKTAADKWRKEQARELITSYTLLVENEEATITIPYFVRDPDAKPAEQGYVALNSIRTDAEKARLVLAREFAAASAAMARARNIASALSMEKDIDDIAGRIEAALQKAKDQDYEPPMAPVF